MSLYHDFADMGLECGEVILDLSMVPLVMRRAEHPVVGTTLHFLNLISRSANVGTSLIHKLALILWCAVLIGDLDDSRTFRSI